MTDILVRDAREADAVAIAAIHVRTWQHAYRDLMPDAYLDGLSVSDRLAMWSRILARPAPRSTVLVAETDGAIAGFVMAGPSGDDDASAATAQLFTIYVEPAAMGRGVGSALLLRIQQRLTDLGFAEATLWVLTGNERGRRFYERHGWRTDGATKREELGATTVDEIRYRTSLRPSDAVAAGVDGRRSDRGMPTDGQSAVDPRPRQRRSPVNR